MKRDWALFADIILLITIGLTTLYSTVVGEENILFGGGVLNKQLIFVVIGLAIYFSINYLNYRIFQHYQVFGVLYVLTVILLILLLIFGREINNARRWIILFGVQFQVSEIAKLVVILVTCGVMSMKDRINSYKLAGISLALTLFISLLVFLEPDAGTAIVILGIWALTVFASLPNQLLNLGMLIVAVLSGVGINLLRTQNIWAIILLAISVIVGIIIFIRFEKLKWFVVGVFFGGILLGFTANYAWNNVLQDYQRQRVESFLNPEEDIQGSGFQVAQSKVAIGSGMIWGKGFGHGTQSKLNFLPEHETDFVFASFAEEFGLVGSLFVIALYSFAIFRILSISNNSSDFFGKILCIGLAIKLLVEVFINIGMNLGVIPATGVPLPLMSAGGSIFLVTMFAFGLVQNVYANRDEF
ncbi:MAG: FtsW/RodA/SpoVE family cell cycle protein [bacterium]